MKLHVVYRIYGGENRKRRPDYYSKRASLASALRSAENADADVVVLADGPIPEDLLQLARSKAKVIQIEGGPVGMQKSFMAAVRYPLTAGWPDDDLVYFCEDDYLHRPHALSELKRAASALKNVGYFALYSDLPLHHSPPWTDSPPCLELGGTHWENTTSTTSTFGARIGALRKDLGIIRQALIPYPTRILDREMFYVTQGRFPFTPIEVILGDKPTRFRTGLNAFAANTVLAPFRLAYNLRALSRRRNPHFLYLAKPNLASHMETELLATGFDWASEANSAETWADSH